MRPVIVRGGTSFRTEINTGTHTFIADEPVDAGGSDAGPTPYDFLSAALGACTSMTIHVVAQREKIPIRGVELTITNDRMHAKDCAECTTQQGYIHRFSVTLKIDGDLTPEQRNRVLEVARRCPVYKTLSSEIRIDEVVVE
jgi:uncharacterized OsmC-like protein